MRASQKEKPLLDATTRRRIDSARDILVGKVPDPKSQVEQITIALIYKFMDDMDAESEELGGKRTFFAGEFAKYGWANIMAPGVGGFEMMNLYGEAIATMGQNPGIPALFREIFKNAYLPYRDPETLRAFLKEINGFAYDHSERLGDAFEYLLSVLGSQGDAGQFRTPRHIIDFIVEVVDPKKGEVILDPACGTAGFLISSYKHILNANADNRPGDQLTTDERTRLAENLKGYDISPDMVRLSLANMYLHGFPQPHIEEYDTLTSEDKWNEYADVILANPPFMSPKGGIRPHKRFSVPSNRSEVLFVDYIAEHLTPAGRAGVIVPEGIIFQSGTAYKTLRKMLVENHLIAVVSLPAGVFQPYSGVKTSVLIMDRARAKTADSVLFVKIETDGYGLGAQRRKIETDDLPAAVRALTAWATHLSDGTPFPAESFPLAHPVPKSKIAQTLDYNLSGDRYRSDAKEVQTSWPIVELGDYITIMSGGTPSKGEARYWEGSIPWVSPKDMKVDFLRDTEDHVSEEAVLSSATKIVPANTLLCVVRSGILKHSLPLALTTREMCFNQDILALSSKSPELDIKFLFHLLKSQSEKILQEGIKPGVTVQSFHSGFFRQFSFPLPPLDVQREIVAEIEGYQKIVDGARQVVENYQPRIPLRPEWPIVALGDICDIGGTVVKTVDGDLPYIGADSIEANTGKLIARKSAKEQGVIGPIFEFGGRRILYSKIRPYLNKLSLVDFEGYCSSDMYPLTVNEDKAIYEYLTLYLLSKEFNEGIKGFYERASIPKINRNQLFSVAIPLPDLATQRAIVAEIEEEQKLVDANRQLLRRFTEKIQQTIAKVWQE